MDGMLFCEGPFEKRHLVFNICACSTQAVLAKTCGGNQSVMLTYDGDSSAKTLSGACLGSISTDCWCRTTYSSQLIFSTSWTAAVETPTYAWKGLHER